MNGNSIKEAALSRQSICVVMPNYNHGRYLAQAIRAILPQLGRDDSLIVIDDCSTDDSVAVYEHTVGDDPRVRLVRNPQNRGVISNLNIGLVEARQPYVYFAAADDMVGPTFITRSLELLDCHLEAALSVALTRTMDAQGKDTGRLPNGRLSTACSFVPPETVRRSLMRDDTWLSGNTTIYRRDQLLAIGGFRPELGSFTDGFAGRLLACRHGVVFVPEELCHWRRLPTAYSHIETLDLVRRRTVEAEATRLMTEEFKNDFPPGYAARWSNRWEYGARALELRSRFVGSSIVRLLVLVPLLASLFLRLRAADAPWVVRRRIANIIEPLLKSG